MRLLSKLRALRRSVTGKPFFATGDVKIGKNVTLGRDVVFNCKRVRIGDGTTFQSNITINCDTFDIGDYGTIYRYCFFPGPGELRIGHNFWLGASSIVDSQGGTTIGNNVGVGAHSQLWTHIAFGDVMYGSRFHGVKPLTIGDDVWLVGHCLVSPVNIRPKAMAMLGSIITKDMEENHTYAGNPARDLTDKLGSQFRITSIEERRAYMHKRLDDFAQRENIPNVDKYVKIVDNSDMMHDASDELIVFNIADRTYTKRGSTIENRLMRFLLPDAKFIPVRSWL